MGKYDMPVIHFMKCSRQDEKQYKIQKSG